MRRTFLAPLLAAAAAAPAAAAPAPPPPAVRAHLSELDKECRGYGGRPGSMPGLVQSADLTGDGLADYVVDLNVYNCDGAASAMGAGQSGAGLSVFVGGPGGAARRAYDNTTYGAKIVTAAGKARLWLDTAGSECGQRGANIPFSDWKFCSRPVNWNAAARAFAYAPLAEAKPIQ
ncbi:hypothetical protein [Phenylobacterium sp.]|jgi:hypothetical protein|uniref:hypothetical protein n=1 Tax=Phenylobacterium sp. TaxID=1871053 RepID=UPI002F40B5CE